MPTAAYDIARVVLLTVGVGLIFAALALLLGLGPGVRIARRLAGAPGMPVGEVAALDGAPPRPVRVAGRVRSADPIRTPDGERFVVIHRDIDVELAGLGWRPVERIRESRSFDLWDHAGMLTVDPARAAEPLVAIPAVWRGTAAELPAELLPAVEALEQRHRRTARGARAVTRAISVVDRLLVLAAARIAADGSVALEPPAGGYVISNLDLDASMRLLVGEHRRRLLAGYGALLTGTIAAAAAAMLGIVPSLLGSG